MPKPRYESKTLWFNILVTVIGITTAFQSMPTFNKYAPVFAIVLAVGNVILRVWFTTQPLQ